MVSSFPAVCFALSIVISFVAADTAAVRQPLAARRAAAAAAAVAQRSNAPDDCTYFDSIWSAGQDCAYLAEYWGIETEDFISWNPQVGANCQNIVVGEEYCVERNFGLPPIATSSTSSSVPPSTTTSAGNGISTPTPTQPGMVDNCNKFALIQSTTTCESIASYYKISLDNILQWNTGFNKACTNLWLDTYACVGVIGGTSPPPSTTTSAGNGIATPTPTQPGMVSNCNKFARIQSTTTCESISNYYKISMEDILRWNTGFNKACTNLWLDTYYCIGVLSGSSPPPSTTTSAGNGIATPTPTQPGMVSNCNKFHLVKDTTTCQGIADYNKVSLSDVLKWNTGINQQCTNLWLGAYACAGVIGGGSSPPPTTTTSRPGNGIATPTPTQPGMVSNCNKFARIQSTTTCSSIANYYKISFADILKWNTGLNKDCTNLWLDTYACVGVIGGGSSAPPTTTTSRPGNGVATPTPTQPGMVSNCNKFARIKSTTTCQTISDYYKISIANIRKWNTGINSACTNLWLDTYACVGVIGSARLLGVGNDDVEDKSFSSSSSDLTSSPAPTATSASAESSSAALSDSSADSSTLSSPSMVHVPVGTPGPLGR